MTSWRCLFWVQSLLGSGHLRRALTLSEGMAAEGACVLLVNGGLPGPWPAPRGVELVQLPPIVTRDVRFQDLVDAEGESVTSARWDQRRTALLQLLATHQPDVILTELFPFGRRAFRGELMPLLEAARGLAAPCLVAASVRDVLVSKPDLHRYEWMLEVCRCWYDLVLVHGDERLLPFSLSFPFADALGSRLVHTGFVHLPRPQAGPPGSSPAVVVSAGGGIVGAHLLRTALAARGFSALGHRPWLLVAGQNLAERTFAELQRAAVPGCTLVRHHPELATVIGAAEVSVSQAGYNTVVEGLQAGARMVLVPFAAGGEDEQTRRATRLHELGLAEMLHEDALSPGMLARAIDRMAARPRPDGELWSFGGAAQTAAILGTMVDARRSQT